MDMKKETINKIIDYIEKNLDKDLNLDKISEKSGYSKFHLNRMFFEETNMTIHKYIVKRRLTEAARKLVYSNMSILDVSFLYGYESQQAFTNAFSRFYKTSPLNYRLKREFYPLQKELIKESCGGLIMKLAA